MVIKHFTFNISSHVAQMKSRLGQLWWVWLVCMLSYDSLLLVFQQGTKAPQAGGKIHTDFEKGFIMAEVSL